MLRIRMVDARTEPLLYFLADLLGKNVPHGYYREVINREM